MAVRRWRLRLRQRAGTRRHAHPLEAPPGISFRDVGAPPPQPTMPDDAAGLPAEAPVVEIDSIDVPSADLLADRTRS
ncbi:hypothetical protein GCM10025865_13360 [Paraoerskovia sediminicola]|uniref:Uncharacterized protein n=1 Tax=Paraoerskovia sediminicola TaxID=1138587 RepID=A0ABM8G1V9_9CELL|nr:hypothetical protein GCM10025865_13360 [Paraoerskovia sediminicola]